MTSVAGNLKNAIMTVVGAIVFSDYIFDIGNAVGLGLSMGGAIWYATRSALKARQNSIKNSLLSRQPVIGRDRLRKLSGGGSLDERDAGARLIPVRTTESWDVRMNQPQPASATTS